MAYKRNWTLPTAAVVTLLGGCVTPLPPTVPCPKPLPPPARLMEPAESPQTRERLMKLLTPTSPPANETPRD